MLSNIDKIVCAKAPGDTDEVSYFLNSYKLSRRIKSKRRLEEFPKGYPGAVVKSNDDAAKNPIDTGLRAPMRVRRWKEPAAQDAF